METINAITKRASLKTCLAERDVEQEKIEKILEAARLAPSARNNQPWRFVVVRGKENVENLVMRAFAEGNHVIKKAPVIIIVCANPNDDIISDGKQYYLFDVGLAVENLLLTATDLGLVTHPMAGANETELKRILGIPENVRFIVATPVAYPSQNTYDDAARERLNQRTRKDLKEIAYLNNWGKSL